jgi:DNA-directed RNA polymerase subunit K/omega
MSKINEYLSYSTGNYINTQNLDEIFENTGNLYQSIVIIAKRANQIASELKNELHFKLEDMRKVTDEIDEITESREQIELSKHYEKLAHPTLIATKEFLEKKLEYRSLEVE